MLSFIAVSRDLVSVWRMYMDLHVMTILPPTCPVGSIGSRGRGGE